MQFGVTTIRGALDATTPQTHRLGHICYFYSVSNIVRTYAYTAPRVSTLDRECARSRHVICVARFMLSRIESQPHPQRLGLFILCSEMNFIVYSNSKCFDCVCRPVGLFMRYLNYCLRHKGAYMTMMGNCRTNIVMRDMSGKVINSDDYD